MVLATLIVVFGGFFLAIWIIASIAGFIKYNRNETTAGMVGWLFSLVGAGICLAFYIHWLNAVFG